MDLHDVFIPMFIMSADLALEQSCFSIGEKNLEDMGKIYWSKPQQNITKHEHCAYLLQWASTIRRFIPPITRSFVQRLNQNNNNLYLLDSIHSGPVMQKIFPYHEVIIKT